MQKKDLWEDWQAELRQSAFAKLPSCSQIKGFQTYEVAKDSATALFLAS